MIHLLAFKNGNRQRTWCDSIIHIHSRVSVQTDIQDATCPSCLYNVRSYERAVNRALNEASR